MSEALSKIPLFAGMSERDRDDLGALLKTRLYQSNAPVFWVGEQGTEFYIVQSGRVAISCPDESGKEVTLAHLGPGHFFGEISLLDGGPRTATVRAEADTALLALTREQFHAFLRDHPSAAVHMLSVLGRRQRETNEKLRGVRNANDAIQEQESRWDRVSSTIADLSASQQFILVNVVLCFGWMAYNVVKGENGFDPPPFGLLGFVLSAEALFISLFVLISQNVSGKRDRIRADLDYQTNLKAQYEVMQLHRKVDQLQATLERQFPAAAQASEPSEAASGNGAGPDRLTSPRVGS